MSKLPTKMKNKNQRKRQTFSFPSFQTCPAQFSNFSMETEISIIKNTEMGENKEYQQCASDEIIEIVDSPSPVSLEELNDKETVEEQNVPITNIGNAQEEPIDLTFDRRHSCGSSKVENVPISTPRRIIIQAKQPEVTIEATITGKGIKRTADFFNSSNKEIIMQNWTQSQNAPLQRPSDYRNYEIPQQDMLKSSSYPYAILRAPHQELAAPINTRQQEILKMAKSIFSKRTRTLYHWMYPTASKQQIKQVVSSTWDSMAAQEKNIYIAQVLGRFGYTNANLMINPQLGQIKELPPMPGIQDFSPKASELQNAISSISNETENVEACYTVEQPRKIPKISKKKVTPHMATACPEFDDDPELSQELAQFSIMLKNQF